MNLLTDPIFRVRTPEGTNGASLPELLALLGEDQVESLPGLQRHQEDAFHIFCCYLVGAVLARAGDTNPAQSADYWREGIRTLTRDEGCADDSAWTLVVADPTKPAFMQPPAPNDAAFALTYKLKATTPDALDILQTAKNHDVKAARSAPDSAEAWCYAVITLQTMIGYLGAGNWGIARMNSGVGSRPCVSLQQSHRPGARMLRDIPVLLSHREKLLKEPYQYQPAGKVLLWLYVWDGESSLSLSALDPFFLEFARRIRLISRGDGYQALAATSSVLRVAAKQQKGNLGDPWIPIDQRSNGALTISETGFTPERTRNLIFGDGFTPAAMQEVTADTGASWFTASVLVRGNGTTDGFHEAIVRVPEKARSALFGKGVARNRLALLSKKGLDAASAIQYKVLRPALFSLMEGGPESIVVDKTEIAKWVDHVSGPFTLNWNPRYFDWLWSTVEIPNDDEALRPWFDELRQLAQETLTHAAERAPQRHGRSYRAKTKAQGMFFGSLKKNFPQFMEVTHDKP